MAGRGQAVAAYRSPNPVQLNRRPNGAETKSLSRRIVQLMKRMKLATIVAAAAAAITVAAPAQADDYDAPFNAQLHNYGIYGPQDFNAWLGKISCERVQRGVDGDAHKSATFIQRNLPLGTSQGQALQFLGAAIDHYCPDQVGFLQRAGT